MHIHDTHTHTDRYGLSNYVEGFDETNVYKPGYRPFCTCRSHNFTKNWSMQFLLMLPLFLSEKK